jgi:hypothetical protein
MKNYTKVQMITTKGVGMDFVLHKIDTEVVMRTTEGTLMNVLKFFFGMETRTSKETYNNNPRVCWVGMGRK